MAITLRQESATGATTKGSALTYSELDNNFIHLLRQGSVTVRADSGTDQTLGEADQDSILQIAGGTDISTVISSDSAGETVLTLNFTGTTATDTQIVGGTGITVSQPDSAGAWTITSDITQGITDINGGTDISVVADSAGGVTVSYTGSAIDNVVEDTTPQLGGNLDGQGNQIQDVEMINYKEDVYSLGTTSGTITPDVANGNVQTITLDGNLTFSAFANAEAGQSMTLIIDTNGTSRTLTSTMLFAGGTKTLSITDTVDIMTVFYDGSTYYASLATNFS
jgi:hypothetical protein